VLERAIGKFGKREKEKGLPPAAAISLLLSTPLQQPRQLLEERSSKNSVQRTPYPCRRHKSRQQHRESNLGRAATRLWKVWEHAFISITPIATIVTTAGIMKQHEQRTTISSLLPLPQMPTTAAGRNRTSDGQERAFGKFGKGEMTAPCCCHPFVSINPIATTVTTAGIM
jgi:hypothetical protein